MQTYEIETQETCTIKCNVEGHHVAAALDSLLGARRVGKALCVPYLAPGLILRISTLKPLEVIKAAQDGGCMPGMVLAALMTIKQRALFWHNKACKHEAAELRRQEALDARRQREKESEEGRAHGDVDQATESRPDLPGPDPVKVARPRKKGRSKVR